MSKQRKRFRNTRRVVNAVHGGLRYSIINIHADGSLTHRFNNEIMVLVKTKGTFVIPRPELKNRYYLNGGTK